MARGSGVGGPYRGKQGANQWRGRGRGGFRPRGGGRKNNGGESNGAGAANGVVLQVDEGGTQREFFPTSCKPLLFRVPKDL